MKFTNLSISIFTFFVGCATVLFIGLMCNVKEIPFISSISLNNIQTVIAVEPMLLPVQDPNDEVNTAVDQFIARQEKIETAVEYKDARKFLRGDIDRDEKEDVVVLYSLESFSGTNLWIQYLVIFTNRDNKFLYATHRSVGGKNQRALSLESILKGEINLDTQEYLRQDASCCPSGKGRTRFMFSNGKLKEIK